MRSVRLCAVKITTFTKEGDWIVDPFAGSGTVGVEVYLCKRNALLLDLNLLLDHIMPLKVYRGNLKSRIGRQIGGDSHRNVE